MPIFHVRRSEGAENEMCHFFFSGDKLRPDSPSDPSTYKKLAICQSEPFLSPAKPRVQTQRMNVKTGRSESARLRPAGKVDLWCEGGRTRDGECSA